MKKYQNGYTTIKNLPDVKDSSQLRRALEKIVNPDTVRGIPYQDRAIFLQTIALAALHEDDK